MSRISVRGVAVASATAVTAVGAVVGMDTGEDTGQDMHTVEAADATLLTDVPDAKQAQQVSDNMTRQAASQQHAADVTAKKKAEAERKKAAEEAHKKKAEEARKKAAEKAKKEAKERAEKAKKKKEKEEQERASRSDNRSDISSQSTSSDSDSGDVSGGSPQAMARQIVPSGQYQCFSNIVERESGWNPKATNPSSGAYGLVQANPGSKMASVSSDWRTNPATQIKWGLNYMNSRYGSPCEAWSFWQTHHAY